MKYKSLVTIGLSSAALLAFSSCKDSSSTAAEDLKESVKEATEASAENTKEVAEKLGDAAEAKANEVAETLAIAPQSNAGNPQAEAQAMATIESLSEILNEHADIMESITDKDSAKTAIEKLGKLSSKYKDMAMKGDMAIANGLNEEQQASLEKLAMEKTSAVQQRMQESSMSAMQIISTDPELMQGFQEASMKIAEAMAEPQ